MAGQDHRACGADRQTGEATGSPDPSGTRDPGRGRDFEPGSGPDPGPDSGPDTGQRHEQRPEQGRGRRLPKPATPERLEKAALAYLERFEATEDSLRRTLMRRVDRSARLHDTDRDAGASAVADIVRRCAAAGYVDDGRYARLRADSLTRRGDSPALVRRKLVQKGVDRDTADSALAEVQAEYDGDAERAAAVALARRRRLGPFQPDPARREARRQKDVAALARAGYPPNICWWVVDAETAEALEADLAVGG